MYRRVFILDLIGYGSFAHVYGFEDSNKKYAKKILDVCTDGYLDKNNKLRFEREVNLLKQFDHPNIVSLVDYKLDSSEFSYTMERYLYNLEEYITLSGSFGSLNDNLHLIFSGIIKAIKYSHSQGIVHRDLKPRNILINSINNVVVCDFGIAMLPNNNEGLTTAIQGFDSGGFTAPEIRHDARSATIVSDVYSLGKILQYLISGEFQEDNINNLPINVFLKKIIKESSSYKLEERIQNIETFEIRYNLAVNEYLSVNKQDTLRLKIVYLNNTYDEELMMEISTEMYSVDDNIRFYDLMMSFSKSSLESWYVEDDSSLQYCTETYISYIESNEFFCSYDEVDKIVEQLIIIYNLEQPNAIPTVLKATIFMCIATISKNYNRFHTMRKCLSLIFSWDNSTDIFTYLKENNTSFQATLKYIKENESYTDKNKIHPTILEYIN